MPTGRPPKPIERKRRAGNPGKRSLPAASNLAAVPAITAEIHELPVGVALDAVLGEGRAWLAATDAPLVAMLREGLEERESLRAAVMAGHGDRSDLRALDKQVASQLSLLGFSPADRARLGLAEVKAQSTLAKLRAAQK